MTIPAAPLTSRRGRRVIPVVAAIATFGLVVGCSSDGDGTSADPPADDVPVANGDGVTTAPVDDGGGIADTGDDDIDVDELDDGVEVDADQLCGLIDPAAVSAAGFDSTTLTSGVDRFGGETVAYCEWDNPEFDGLTATVDVYFGDNRWEPNENEGRWVDGLGAEAFSNAIFGLQVLTEEGYVIEMPQGMDDPIPLAEAVVVAVGQL